MHGIDQFSIVIVQGYAIITTVQVLRVSKNFPLDDTIFPGKDVGAGLRGIGEQGIGIYIDPDTDRVYISPSRQIDG